MAERYNKRVPVKSFTHVNSYLAISYPRFRVRVRTFGMTSDGFELVMRW